MNNHAKQTYVSLAILIVVGCFTLTNISHADVQFTFPSNVPTYSSTSFQSFLNEFSAPFLQFENSINTVSRDFYFTKNSLQSINPTIQTIQTTVKATPEYYQKFISVVNPIFDVLKPIVRIVGGFILVILRLTIDFIQKVLMYIGGLKQQ